jgi:hypothetical protein
MEVAIEHFVPTFHGFVEQVNAMIGTGSIEEHIDLSPFLFDLCDKSLGRDRVRYVTANGQWVPASFRDGLGCLLRLGFTRSVTEGNPPLPSSEIEGNAAPNAFRTAGDQRNVVYHRGLWREDRYVL